MYGETNCASVIRRSHAGTTRPDEFRGGTCSIRIAGSAAYACHALPGGNRIAVGITSRLPRRLVVFPSIGSVVERKRVKTPVVVHADRVVDVPGIRLAQADVLAGVLL